MVIGDSLRLSRVPCSAPSVTTNVWAARPRFTLAGRPAVVTLTPRGAATSRLLRAPTKRSRRMTPTTVNTNSHSRRRTPKRATVMTYSGKLAVHSEREGGRSELDHVTWVQGNRRHPLAVDRGAVGRSKIGQHHLTAIEVDPG